MVLYFCVSGWWRSPQLRSSNTNRCNTGFLIRHSEEIKTLSKFDHVKLGKSFGKSDTNCILFGRGAEFRAWVCHRFTEKLDLCNPKFTAYCESTARMLGTKFVG